METLMEARSLARKIQAGNRPSLDACLDVLRGIPTWAQADPGVVILTDYALEQAPQKRGKDKV